MTERIKTYDEMTIPELREHIKECQQYERDYRQGATSAQHALDRRVKDEAKALVDSLDPDMLAALARQIGAR